MKICSFEFVYLFVTEYDSCKFMNPWHLWYLSWCTFDNVHHPVKNPGQEAAILRSISGCFNHGEQDGPCPGTQIGKFRSGDFLKSIWKIWIFLIEFHLLCLQKTYLSLSWHTVLLTQSKAITCYFLLSAAQCRESNRLYNQDVLGLSIYQA